MNIEARYGFEKEPNPALERVLVYLEERFRVVGAVIEQTVEDIDQHPDSYKSAAGSFTNLDYDDDLDFMFMQRIILAPPESISEKDEDIDDLEALLKAPTIGHIPKAEQLNEVPGDQIGHRLLDRRLHVYRPVDIDDPTLPLENFETTYVLRYEAEDKKNLDDLFFVLDKDYIEQFHPDNRKDKADFMQAMEFAINGEPQASHNMGDKWQNDTVELFLNKPIPPTDKELSAMIETSLVERNLMVFK